MSDWTAVAAGDVRVGDHVRLPNGEQLSVTRVDPDHLGVTTYVKLVEDTEDRWLCYALPKDRELEALVRRTG